jgi:hypothetical protein
LSLQDQSIRQLTLGRPAQVDRSLHQKDAAFANLGLASEKRALFILRTN